MVELYLHLVRFSQGRPAALFYMNLGGDLVTAGRRAAGGEQERLVIFWVIQSLIRQRKATGLEAAAFSTPPLMLDESETGHHSISNKINSTTKYLWAWSASFFIGYFATGQTWQHNCRSI